MLRLVWPPPAFTNAQRRYRFLAPKDEVAVHRAIKTIRAGVKIQALQSEIGRPIEYVDPMFREWLIDFGSSGHVALYHFDGETATILAVRDQKEAEY